MKSLLSLTVIVLLATVAALSSCAVQEEMASAPRPAGPPEVKVKPVKAAGDIGLLDLEKNYLILVTKEGKLITADFTAKTKATKFIPEKAKVSDIDLGQSATVTYVTQGSKNIAQSVEYTVKAQKGQ